MTLPVYVCSIAKNEAKHVRRWAESAKGADAIYMLDTGSDDDTVAIARECGVIVFEKTYDDWSFAVARNDLREMLPDHDAWLFNLDLDEVLIEGWREHLDAVPLDVNRPRYLYTWNWDENGKPGLQYHGDKCVRRHSHKWVNRVHEVNVAVGEERQGFMGLEAHHHADDTKSRGSYLPLLLLDVEENPDNDRNVYYAARELMYYGRKEESIAMFKRHISMPTATWDAERAFSMRYIGLQSPIEQREHWLMRACAEFPYGRECWIELAKHYQDVENWPGCFDAANRALSITNRGDLYLTEGLMWGFLPHDLLALAAANLNRMDVAVYHGTLALSHEPDDQRLKNNLVAYKLKNAKVDVIIPTKSNSSGLATLISQLKCDYKVNRIVVVADGDAAYQSLATLPNDIIKLMVPLGIGIHRMWNLAMQVLGPKNYIAFINDDISLAPNCMSTLMQAMVEDPSIGLICPNYSTTPNEYDDKDRQVYCVSGHRYDGLGDFAGFCFMLAKDLVPHWDFDEAAVWLSGDNDIVDWCYEVVHRRAIVTHKTRCVHEESHTFNEDPPEGWLTLMHADKLVYQKKRDGVKDAKSYN